MSEAKLITISMDEYKRLDALRARVAELEAEADWADSRAFDLRARVAELEAENERLRKSVADFVDVCDNAPPVEFIRRISDLVEPARAALDEAERG